jgi:hypothetical protein
MDEQATPDGLALAAGFRPAQLGAILVGRVSLGHIGATVVDLASRGYLRIDAVHDDPADWKLTDLGASPDGLLGYERVLLDGLFDGPTAICLKQVTSRMVPMLEKVRSEVLRDASSAGLLGPGLALPAKWRRARGPSSKRRTKAGRELLGRINEFRRELRALAGDDNDAALARYAAYAMIFGLNAPLPTGEHEPPQPSDGADQQEHTADFTACWKKEWLAVSPSMEWRLKWMNVDMSSHGHAASHGHGYGYDHVGGYDGGHGGGGHI